VRTEEGNQAAGSDTPDLLFAVLISNAQSGKNSDRVSILRLRPKFANP